MCPYRGVSYVNQSMTEEKLTQKFVTEKAPRTAVVLNSNGSLSLMQVELEIDIYKLCDFQ